MSNTITNPTIFAKETLMQLENNCVMAKLVHRSHEAEYQTRSNGWKKGATITIKAPMYARVKDGPVIDVVDALEQTTTLTVNYHKTVAFKITASEMTLNLEGLSRDFIQPAMVAMGNFIDLSILGLYNGIPNQVGTPGSTPATTLPYGMAQAVLMNHAVPMDDKISCVVGPFEKLYLAEHLKHMANPSINGPAVERSKFGNIANMDMYVSQNVPRHTCGTAAGLTTNLVDGAAAEEAVTITIDQNSSWSNTLTAGDIFTVAGVNGVNPVSGVSTGQLRQFVNTVAVTDAGNEQAISCIPGVAPYNIRSSAAAEDKLPYQNVTSLPADNAAINIAGTASLEHVVNLAFHRDSLALVMVPFEIGESCPWKATMTKNGYSVTVTKAWDPINFAEYLRFDVLFGLKVLNPFMACRIAG